MRFLADESCDFAVVTALRSANHDVVAICEVTPRAEDREVAKLAIEQQRVVITEDKDFGQLVYAEGQGAVEVILLRYPARARGRIVRDTLEALERLADSLRGSFAVVRPGRVRITRLPR